MGGHLPYVLGVAVVLGRNCEVPCAKNKKNLGLAHQEGTEVHLAIPHFFDALLPSRWPSPLGHFFATGKALARRLRLLFAERNPSQSAKPIATSQFSTSSSPHEKNNRTSPPVLNLSSNPPFPILADLPGATSESPPHPNTWKEAIALQYFPNSEASNRRHHHLQPLSCGTLPLSNSSTLQPRTATSFPFGFFNLEIA